jgi:hypothetical protein
MSKVSAETPRSAQQKPAGTDSTKATGEAGATANGAVRIAPTGGALEG